MTREFRVALAEAKRVLHVDPRHAAGIVRSIAGASGDLEAQFILGAALRRTDDLPGALAVLAPLAGRAPRAWGIQFEHGMTLAALGRTVAASAALAQATAANPASSLAAHALAEQYALLGRADAVAARSQAGAVDDPALLAAVAAMLDGGDDRIAAFGLYLTDLAAVCLVAAAAVRLGRPGQAVPLLASALDRAPTFDAARHALALVLFRLDRADLAAQHSPALVARYPGTAVLLALDAAIRLQLGDAVGAIAGYSRALAITPDAHVWQGMGHAARAAGRQADAVAAYRAAIALRPGFGEAWWSLANLKTWAFDPDDHTKMAELLETATDDDRIYLHFALGKALEDAAQHGAAFEQYSRGNAARRVQLPHDAAAASDFVRRSIVALTPAMIAPAGGSDAADPIFVVGMPRSGTTLVEQILASHSQVEGASELPDITDLARGLARRGSYPEILETLAPAERTALGADYLARTRVRRRLGRAHFVDKFPGNALHLPLIHLILPRATIIDVRRHPLACCWSLFKQVFAGGQAYSYDLADLGRAYADYVALTARVDRVLPGRVLRLDYEALVDDPEGQTRRLLDHIGLPFEPACLRFFETDRVIRTPSSEQVRRPIFRDGLDQWRNFTPWLGPLVNALDGAMPILDGPIR